MKQILTRIEAMLNSRRFFWIILLFFALESAWIALSAVYPQAFDENFHFGLIKIYSHHWLPFLTSQPAGGNQYGAVFRDPSYLYHYTMSFPYRLIALFVHGQTPQVIIMRFLNIVLAGIGLISFRKVLLRANFSQAFTNTSMLIFVLIPIVPQLAGQINYDDLLFPLVAWTCLLAMQMADEFTAKRPSVRTLFALATVCLLASLVKYEFLPITLSVGLFALCLASKNFKHSWRKLWTNLLQSWRTQAVWMRLLLVVILLCSVTLFAQRDVVNILKYHAIEPNCSKVLNVQSCQAYSPWGSDYNWHQQVKTHAVAGTPDQFANPISYTGTWFYWLWYRLFFAINGPASGFKNYPPLPLPAVAAVLLALFGAAAIVVRARALKIFHDPYMLFFTLATVVYSAALWISGYLQYRYTHVLVLMNGRYLLPILPLAAALIGQPIATWLRNATTLKASLTTLTLILFLQGGGVVTFIARSDKTWDWPNTTVVKANNAARDALRPVVLSGRKTYDARHWLIVN